MPQFSVVGPNPGGSKPTVGRISENGEVIVRPYQYSTANIVKLTGATSTLANNLVPAKAQEQFVITSFFVSADKAIAAGGELIEAYQSTGETSTIQSAPFFSIDLARQQAEGQSALESLSAQGSWVNVTREATGGTITVTINGYFVPSIS